MDLLERRRMLMATKEKLLDVNVELPDYWRLDFTTTDADEHIEVGYYSVGSKNLEDLILDGVTNKSLAVNGSAAYVLIPTAGQHTLYLKIKQPFSNSSYWFAVLAHTYDYVRVPYQWRSDIMIGDTNKYATVIRLDVLRSNQTLRGANYNWVGHINQMYVPSGTLSWYKSWTGGTRTSWTQMSDSIKEANFIYTTS